MKAHLLRLFCILILTINRLTYELKRSCRLLNCRYNVTKYFNADNTMNRKSKSLFTLSGKTLTGIVAAAILSFYQVSSDNSNVFCGNLENVVLDQQLPVSHPINRCATEKSQGVSWSSWFSGRSSSYQFHFIDLLELLSRSANSKEKNLTKTNQVHSKSD